MNYWFTTAEGCLLGGIKVAILAKFQDNLLDELHENHPGISIATA